MAAKEKSAKGRKEPTGPISAHEKIARLLGILATKDIEQIRDRVTLSRAVGFSVPEVASILGLTQNHVRVASHHGRKKRRGKKTARSKKN